MNLIFKPPTNIAKRDPKRKYCFLAGSIEMGKAIDWQTDMEDFFIKNGWGTFNPRRADWDSTWKQEFENPMFNQQVSWELDAMEKADIIFMYMQPDTLSPITLIEYGMYVNSGKLFVVTPEGFWRKGNIEITSNRYNCPMFDSFDDFKSFFREHKDRLV